MLPGRAFTWAEALRGVHDMNATHLLEGLRFWTGIGFRGICRITLSFSSPLCAGS